MACRTKKKAIRDLFWLSKCIVSWRYFSLMLSIRKLGNLFWWHKLRQSFSRLWWTKQGVVVACAVSHAFASWTVIYFNCLRFITCLGNVWYGVLSTVYWVLSTECCVLSTEYWVLSAVYWVLCTEYWVLSTECCVLSAVYWVLSTEY